MQSSRAPSVMAFGALYLRALKERDITYHAAALSYYTIISLVPLLTLLLFVTAVFHQENVAEVVTDFTGAYLLPAGEEQVLEALVHLSQASHYSLVSLVIALWGALKLITGLDRSFEAIFESEPVSPTQRVTKGVLTLTVVGLAAIAVAVLVAAIGLIEHPHSHYGPLVLVVVLTVVFFPIFYLLPNADLTPGDALPGTLLTAIGWTVLSTGFAIYVGLLGETIAGVVGAFLLLLTWFYFSGLVILLGGVLNAALLDSKEIRRRRDGPGSGANGS